MDLTPGPERPTADDVKLTSFVTKMIGHQRTMATGLVEVAKGMEAIATGYEALQLTVEEIRQAAYRAGREDWARGVVGYLYVGPDGREMLLDPADVTIVRSESQQPRTPEARGDSEHTQDGGE